MQNTKKKEKRPPSRRGKNDSRGKQCCTANGDGRFEQDRDGEECVVVLSLSDHTDLFSDDQGEQRNCNACRIWSGYLFLRYLPQIM